MIKKLRVILDKKDKKFLILLFIFSVFVSVIEVIGVAIVMPFISLATDFSLIESNSYYKYFYNLFNFDNHISFIIVFGVLLVVFYLLRGIINIFYTYLLSKFSKGRYYIVSSKLFTTYLNLNYLDFINKNSNDLHKTITQEALHITQLLTSFLLIISEIFIVILIYIMMFYMDYKITLAVTLFLVVNVVLLLHIISPRIKQEGVNREKFQGIFYKTIDSVFNNFKLTKLKSDNKVFVDNFNHASYNFSKSNIINETIANIPRLFLEFIGFSVLIIIVIYLLVVNNTDISKSLPLISIFILGLYRLMPSANRILSNYNAMLFCYRSLDIIHNDIMLEQDDLGDNPVAFSRTIELKNIGFNYYANSPTLIDINLTITKGESVAFIGESGSGKSTLVNLIIGLYQTNIGEILIDDIKLDNSNIKSWRKKVGYIPQDIYLFDGNIAENVAFGSQINEEKIKKVLLQANILNFLEQHQNGIYTKVGDKGVKLSGGQKQRIAIARALYNDPEILVLDEATSALDANTEENIMNEMYKIKDKTIIIIAHRINTINRCDKIFSLENGVLKESK